MTTASMAVSGRIRRRPGGGRLTTAVALVFAGCAATAEDGADTAGTRSQLLATAVLEEGHQVDFVEVQPGIVILHERFDANKGWTVETLTSVEERYRLFEAATTEERYLRLAEHDVERDELLRIRESDVRRAELMAKYASGELQAPPPSPAQPASVEKCFDHHCESQRGSASQAGFSTSTFFPSFCQADYDGRQCQLIDTNGTWSTSYVAPTNFFRVYTWRTAGTTGVAASTLHLWNQGNWYLADGINLNPDEWGFFLTDYPYTSHRLRLTNWGNTSAPGVYAAAVWNYQ